MSTSPHTRSVTAAVVNRIGATLRQAAEFEQAVARARATGRQLGLSAEVVAELIDAEVQRSRTTRYPMDWDRVRAALIEKATGHPVHRVIGGQAFEVKDGKIVRELPTDGSIWMEDPR